MVCLRRASDGRNFGNEGSSNIRVDYLVCRDQHGLEWLACEEKRDGATCISVDDDLAFVRAAISMISVSVVRMFRGDSKVQRAPYPALRKRLAGRGRRWVSLREFM